MKLRWKIVVWLVAVAALCTVLVLLSDSNARTALEETRRTLRQQGFKIDLAEFDFSTSPELRARAAMLGTTTWAELRAQRTNWESRWPVLHDVPTLMSPVGSNAAAIVWKLEKLEGAYSDDLWPELREMLNTNRARLDASAHAALSGPIRFEPIGSGKPGALLPYLADVKEMLQILSMRALLELHDGNPNAAWTNLLASTCLVTAYAPESIDISHLVRFACAAIAYDATWNSLQSGAWTDAQLAALQRQWESVDFFSGLPETAAFTRADTVAMCELDRQEPLSFEMLLKEMLRSPHYALQNLVYGWREYRYCRHGTYEDERALLLHYRDRELELRRAVQCPTWSEMRRLHGVTNMVRFQSKYHSRTQMRLNSWQLTSGFQMQGRGLLGCAADAETRRRLIITAIALERFLGRHGSYPKTLQELVPELLQNPPMDFMDGQPLRYCLTPDGHFVLYSVGLDCTDNGGNMQEHERRRAPHDGRPRFGIPQGTDLVWPRPASTAEAKAQWEEDKHRKEEHMQAVLKKEAVEEERAEALRRATVEKLLAMKPARRAKEPTYQGRPLSKLLRNEKASGAKQLTLGELLTLKQIITGEEPDIATFELPINYDVVTNIGEPRLLVDAEPEEFSTSKGGEFQGCERATNGNCLLIWNTDYDPPGQHALQAQILCTDKKDWHTVKVNGPVAPFYSSNICQFDPFFSSFDSHGATLYAKLPEPNGIYTIELKSPNGERIKTFAGTTSNGVIKVDWDLRDDHGNKYTNDFFESTFSVTLPDSGRSQTLKGK